MPLSNELKKPVQAAATYTLRRTWWRGPVYLSRCPEGDRFGLPDQFGRTSAPIRPQRVRSSAARSS